MKDVRGNDISAYVSRVEGSVVVLDSHVSDEELKVEYDA